MRLGVDFNILNQKGTPAFFSDVFANRPAAGFAGRVFISTDTGAIYEDTGSAWTLIADAGAGTTGTLQQVTTNGNTTTQGIVVTSGNVAIGTATAGAPLDVHGTGTNAQFNGTGTNNAYLQFQNAGTSKWRIGNTYAAGVNNYEVYNNPNTTTAISINGTTSVLTVNKGTRLGGTSGDDQLYVYGTSPSMRLYNTLTSPTIVGFVGMATATNNFIQGTASGDMAIGTSTGGKIFFGSANGTVTPAMTITNAGIVGMNTLTPSSLSVLTLQETAGIASALSLLNRNSTQQWRIAVDAAAVDDKILAFIDQTSGTVKMGITQPGNVLIGTSTDAGQKLQISGTVKGTSYFESNDGTRDMYFNPAADFGFGTLPAIQVVSNHALQFATNNTLRMTLTNTGNLLIGTGTTGASKLRIVGLPTSSAGLSSGDIYSNLGILTIVP